MAIALQGSTFVIEGQDAVYRVVLDSASLADGGTVEFSLLVSGVSASEEFDFAEFTSDALIAGDRLGLALLTDPFTGAVTVRITNNTGSPLGAGSSLVTFSLRTTADRLAEPRETYVVDLASSSETVVNSRIQTTIRNVGGIIFANTDSAQWAALSGNITVYEGIAGLSEARRFTVSTGDSDSRVFLTDAIAYANLNLGNGVNDVSILVEPRRDDTSSYVQFGHGAYFARITAGNGNDVINIQSAENVDFVRANPQSIPGYELSDYYQSIVDVGAGSDYVYAFLPFQSQFLGGDGVDTIFFYGRFSDWSYEVVDATENGSLDIALSHNAQDYSVWTVGANISSTARNNRVQGFEFVQFNDILLKIREAISISGPASVGEGATALYTISLAGGGLRAQESVTFDLQVASLSASSGLDFTELAASFLRAAGTFAKLDIIAFDPIAQTLRAVVTANRDLATGTVIANLSVPTVNDAVVEGAEQFSVTLSGFIDPVTAVTTLVDNDATAITLSGPASVVEGSATMPYTVSLSGVGLGVGQSVTFTLDTASGTATEGSDFAALLDGSLLAVAGVALSGVSIGANGVITVTATNTSASDLATGAALLSFSIATTADVVLEATETFTVSLGSSTAAVTTGMVTTTITDNDATAITLSGPASVVEGSATMPYTVSLSGVGLGVGQSVTFTLDTASGTATEGIDFAALLDGSLLAGAGVALSGVSIGANGVITVTATNTSASDLATGAALLSFSIATTADVVVEANETFTVSLGSSTAAVTTGTVTTTITDANTPVIRLDGAASVVDGAASVVEGANASYAVSLDGVGLGAGQTVTLTLDSASGTALEGVDFAALVAGGITAGSGVTLSGISTDPVTKAVTLTATNSSGATLAAGGQLLSISIPTTADLFSEGPETFSVSLSSASATVSAGSITTTITDNDPLAVRISGPASVVEGSATAPYTISLGSGVGLGVGRTVTFSIDTASGTATEGADFAALLASGLTPASGISLDGISTAADGSITVTVTASNTSGADIAAESALLSYGITTTNDTIVEANETFSLNLVGGPGVGVEGPASLPTTITDNDAPALKLTGSATVAEGAAASYALALDGVGLGAGRSVDFRLSTFGDTATQGSDFARLIATNLLPVSGIRLSNISTDLLGVISGRATNIGSNELAVNAELLTFSIAAASDAAAELPETYNVLLSSTDAAVSTATFTTTITDSSLPVIRLTGSTAVAEGSRATYGVSLDGGIALGAGRSVTLTLDTAGISATEGRDFDALVAGSIKPTPVGITLSNISTDPLTQAVTLTATNTSVLDLDAGSQLLSFELPSTSDLFSEGPETFSVSLSSASATVSAGSITTTITDDDPAAIKLTGSGAVAEGASASYSVSLDGVGLGAGRLVSFTLDSASGTATEGLDFAALTDAVLNAAVGITLGTSTAADGSIAVTASNTSGADLVAGAALLSFATATDADAFVEGNETFGLTLTSSSATVTAGLVTTTITDDDAPALKLTGDAAVAEGAAAAYALALDGVGLGAGRSVTFTLDTASGTATEGADFAALSAAALTAAKGITLSGISTAANGTITATATNTSGADLAVGASILSFSLAATGDSIAEGSESYTVSLGGANGSGTVSTTITDANTAVIRLTGSPSVVEGANASYAVTLDGVGLGAGQSVTLTLDTASGTALEGVDFAALVASGITAGAGVTLSGIRTDPVSNAVTLTATNSSGIALTSGSQLVSFSLAAVQDQATEGDETFRVLLGSEAATVTNTMVATTIRDLASSGGGGGSGGTGSGGDGGGSGEPSPRRRISGTNGADEITGSSLNNVIYGGKGADLMTGGGGSNKFRFRLSDGLNQGDVITDFRPGSDTIRVEGVSRNSLAAKAFDGKKRLKGGRARSAVQVADSLDSADRSKAVFIYAQLTGELAYNSNGSGRGFGRDGGVLASLPVLLSFEGRDIQLAYGS